MNRIFTLAGCAGIALLAGLGGDGLAQTSVPKPPVKFPVQRVTKADLVPAPSNSFKQIMLATGDPLVTATNEERKKAGLKPLQTNSLLNQAAKQHADNMARQNNMNHVLDGKGAGDRLKDVGYNYQSYGENIAYNSTNSADAVRWWMGSPGHKANILNATFTQIGVGMSKAANGRIYYCQVFGNPR